MAKDNRITQLSIPMTSDPREIKEYAKQHWNITFARQKKVSVYAKKIMAIVMGQIRDSDFEFLPYYQMRISDIVPEGVDINGAYSEVKKAFAQLANLSWMIEDIEKQKFAVRHLLNTSDVNCGYENGVITVVLNPILKPYFIAIAHYTTHKLKWYMTFSSWYSMRLYELLSAYKDTGLWIVSIKEYRELLDCQEKYQDTRDLITKTLSEPSIELEKTDMAFTYNLVYDIGHQGRGRKPISHIEFRLKKVVLKEIPASWYSYSDSHKKLLMRLLDFKVTQKNITKYAPVIGIKDLALLIRSWEIKESSPDKIQDKEKYCNAVFCRMGKSILEDNK